MKRLFLTLLMPVLFSTSVSADVLCQEEAKAMGYENALETLPPCKPETRSDIEKKRANEASRELEQEEVTQSQDLDSSEQFGQIQTQ